MDDMPSMALIGTAGVDSIITDSANSASAYTTGHKSNVNALGVYADRTPSTLDDPRVETITSLVKRGTRMAVGVVPTRRSRTPASAIVAHTRRHSDDSIVGMFHEARVDVLMGRGAAHFLPKLAPGSRRRTTSTTWRSSRRQLRRRDHRPGDARGQRRRRHPANARPVPPGNMDVLDRKFLKRGTVRRYPIG